MKNITDMTFNAKDKARAQMITRIIGMAVIGLFVFVVIYYPQVSALAAEAGEGAALVSNTVGKVYDIMAAFVSSVGSIIVLWMVFEMGIAVQSQEGTMQANGIKKVGGGLVMVLAPQLINGTYAWQLFCTYNNNSILFCQKSTGFYRVL